MRIAAYVQPMPSIDAVADADDKVDIRIDNRGATQGQTLYVDVNGITVLRIGQLKQEIEVTRS